MQNLLNKRYLQPAKFVSQPKPSLADTDLSTCLDMGIWPYWRNVQKQAERGFRSHCWEKFEWKWYGGGSRNKSKTKIGSLTKQ